MCPVPNEDNLDQVCNILLDGYNLRRGPVPEDFFDLDHDDPELHVMVAHHNDWLAEIGGEREDEEEDDNEIRLDLVLDPARAQHTETVKLSDPKLDVTPVPLGMVHTKAGDVFFLERTCRRQFAQGSTNNNVDGYSITGGGANPQLCSVNVFDTVSGLFPSFEEALDRIYGLPCPDGKNVGCPFGRDLAIIRDSLGLFYLYFRTRRIAWSKDGRTFTLGVNFEFAKEQMEMKGVKFDG